MRCEIWTLPGSDPYERVVAEVPGSFSFTDRFGLGEISISVPGNWNRLPEVIRRYRSSPGNDVLTMARIIDGSTVRAEFLIENVSDLTPGEGTTVTLTGRQVGAVMDWARVECFDWNGATNFHTRDPDWIWGGSNKLQNPSFEEETIVPATREVAFSGPGGGGTWTISLAPPGGALETTAALDRDITAEQLENALELLPSVDDVQVSGTGGVSDDVGITAVFQNLNAASLNPAAFTSGAVQAWSAFTVAVRPAGAGFPNFGDIGDQSSSDRATTHNFDLPSVEAGDRVVALFAHRGTGTTLTTPSGWTLLASATASTTHRSHLLYRTMTGTEDDTPVSWVLSNAQKACVVYVPFLAGSFDSGTAPAFATVGGTASNVDAPNLAPGWGAADNKWLVLAACYNPVEAGNTPSGWTGRTESSTGSGGDDPFLLEFVDFTTLDSFSVNGSGLTGGVTVSVVGSTTGRRLPASWTEAQWANGVLHGAYDAFRIVGASVVAPHEGDKSVMIDPDTANPAGFPGVQQWVSVVPGQLMRASAWVRQEGPGARRFRLVIRAQEETPIAWSEPTYDGKSVNADTWTQLVVPEFIVPDGIDRVIFRLACTSTPGEMNTFYVDDCELREGNPPATVGEIMNALLDDAQVDHVADGREVLPFLQRDFNDNVDAAGVDWDRDVEIVVRHGTSYLEVLNQITAMGYEWAVDNQTGGDYVLRLWNPAGRGTDRTADPDGKLLVGMNAVAGPVGMGIPQGNAVTVEGVGGFTNRSNSAASQTQIQRREVYIPLSDVVTNSEAVAQGDSELASALRTGRTVQLSLLDARPRPYQDFNLGDIVNVDYASRPAGISEPRRVMAMGYAADTDIWTVSFDSETFTGSAAVAEGVRRLLAASKRLVIPRQQATFTGATGFGSLMQGGFPGVPTLVVAASDAHPTSKQRADVICEGSNDELAVGAAVDLLADSGPTARMVFTEGTFIFAAPIPTKAFDNVDLVWEGLHEHASETLSSPTELVFFHAGLMFADSSVTLAAARNLSVRCLLDGNPFTPQMVDHCSGQVQYGWSVRRMTHCYFEFFESSFTAFNDRGAIVSECVLIRTTGGTAGGGPTLTIASSVSDEVSVSGCTLINQNGSIALNSAGNSSRTRVANNHIESSEGVVGGGAAVALAGVSADSVIANNVIVAGRAGISVGSGTDATTDVDRVVISNNVVRSVITSGSTLCVRLADAAGCIINGNYISAATTPGTAVSLGASRGGNIVHGNRLAATVQTSGFGGSDLVADNL